MLAKWVEPKVLEVRIGAAGIRRRIKFYFDSYGLPPPTELVNYLKGPVYHNSERVQPDNTVFCGHLCLYVLKKMQDGLGFQEVVNTLF